MKNISLRFNTQGPLALKPSFSLSGRPYSACFKVVWPVVLLLVISFDVMALGSDGDVSADVSSSVLAVDPELGAAEHGDGVPDDGVPDDGVPTMESLIEDLVDVSPAGPINSNSMRAPALLRYLPGDPYPTLTALGDLHPDELQEVIGQAAAPNPASPPTPENPHRGRCCKRKAALGLLAALVTTTAVAIAVPLVRGPSSTAVTSAPVTSAPSPFPSLSMAPVLSPTVPMPTVPMPTVPMPTMPPTAMPTMPPTAMPTMPPTIQPTTSVPSPTSFSEPTAEPTILFNLPP